MTLNWIVNQLGLDFEEVNHSTAVHKCTYSLSNQVCLLVYDGTAFLNDSEMGAIAHNIDKQTRIDGLTSSTIL